MPRTRAFGGVGPVVDVQTHLVDPHALERARAPTALGGFLHMADPDRWAGAIDPRAHRRRGVGRARVRRVARPRSRSSPRRRAPPTPTCSPTRRSPPRATSSTATRAPAACSRTRSCTPTSDRHELDAMEEWRATLRPSGWKCYTLYGPPTKASPTGGWFLDDDEIGLPFLERVRALGPRVVATHKGLGGPIPDASVAAASPRDIGPAAAAFPDITFVVYHSGYERDPDGAGRSVRRDTRRRPGVDRLVESLEHAGIGAGRQRVRRARQHVVPHAAPAGRGRARARQAARRASGPDRIVWGTDSSGTDHRNRSSTRSARSRFPSACRRSTATRRSPHEREGTHPERATRSALYGIDDTALRRTDDRETWVDDIGPAARARPSRASADVCRRPARFAATAGSALLRAGSSSPSTASTCSGCAATPTHPVSRGYTCPKGRALPDWHHAPDRLDQPLLRGEVATWDDVLDDLAATVRSATAQNGPDAVGGYLATGSRVRHQRVDDRRASAPADRDARALHARHGRQRAGAARGRARHGHQRAQHRVGPGPIEAAAPVRDEPRRVARIRDDARRPGDPSPRLPGPRRPDLRARPAAHRDRRPRRRPPRDPAGDRSSRPRVARARGPRRRRRHHRARRALRSGRCHAPALGARAVRRRARGDCQRHDHRTSSTRCSRRCEPRAGSPRCAARA